VLRLLVQGRTDGEIGQELYVSRKTASVHVTNIEGKLGASSRVGIVTEAIRKGIVTSLFETDEDARREPASNGVLSRRRSSPCRRGANWRGSNDSQSSDATI
jgi:Bacterial regulatory proteins, luxR family